MSPTEITFFLPTRKGSSRVINKNTRNFAGIEGGLLALKLSQLIKSERISEIILSTNDEASMEVASMFSDPRLNVIERPEHLCLNTTALTDLINYVPEITSCPHVLWGHVTTPFVDGADYDQVVSAYFEALNEGYDSLVTVKELKNFLIDPESGAIINTAAEGKGRWPRTQDLKLIYEVNHAAFVSSVENYQKLGDRIGRKVRFHQQDAMTSLDIDWEDDYKIAEAVYLGLKQ
ncbi:acylneuraminate cytidylyltransferase family protein [Roseivirga misakiensis]|uniref:Acylneuraminate cytidylyltransferase n=1 Tax=Roseivirga misakiensis TaxID=1563681 RepID=A0A1E5T1G3_9BACT|nr:acylneuraminate cytidylyltransferase [Roseivirga misakiensis]OEK05210.1 acylneuraminate cytidylyltransferase [Roseivirga misakiensis]